MSETVTYKDADPLLTTAFKGSDLPSLVADKPPHVLITGADLAGLFLGILLVRAGIPYIFERTAEIKPLEGSSLHHAHEKQLIRSIYPNISTGRLDPRDFIDRAFLTILHEDVDLLNSLAIDMLPTADSIEYLSQVSVLDSGVNGVTNYPPGGIELYESSRDASVYTDAQSRNADRSPS
ncbi:hypothetical protein BGX23_011441 [Mortierella sp. AD031]|nr:hypothetical protein BGX23_011441 [Mortierella sp. AD031]